MSVSAMANAALARRSDFPPQGVPRSLQDIATAAASSPAPTLSPGAAAAASAPTAAPSASTTAAAIDAIVAYIPTEVLTLYVAVIGTVVSGAQAPIAAEAAFWPFLLSTPAIVWLVYATKLKVADKPLPWSPSQWPAWEMVAGTIAYSAWALALPESPVSASWGYPSALAGVVVLVVSTLLGLLAPLFQRPISA